MIKRCKSTGIAGDFPTRPAQRPASEPCNVTEMTWLRTRLGHGFAGFLVASVLDLPSQISQQTSQGSNQKQKHRSIPPRPPFHPFHPFHRTSHRSLTAWYIVTCDKANLGRCPVSSSLKRSFCTHLPSLTT